MKVVILNVSKDSTKTINKDLAGGYGTGTHIGNSLRAKIIEWLKRNNIRLPILAAGYAASIFGSDNHEVVYLENTMPDSADLVLIPTSIVDCNNEKVWARKVKEALPGAKVGFFGAFATAQPNFYLDSCDFVIIGEPESAFENLSSEFKPDATKDQDSNKLTKGMLISPLIPEKELDKLPFPAWEKFPLKSYSYSPVIKAKPFVTIQSSRGCVFSCSHYCPYTALQGKRWRDRTVPNVLGEIKRDVEEFGVKGLLFRDPLFTFNKKRITEIAQGIIDNKWDLEWGCETRLDLMDKGFIDHLYRSGMRSINIGVESADPDVCKAGKRLPVKIQHQEDIIRYCDKVGVRLSAFYIIGLGSDTVETVKKTIAYAKHLNTHIAQFTISTPYPGTPFYDEMKDLIYEDDWEKFDAYTPVWRHPNLSAQEMLSLKEEAFVSYYFRPKYIAAFLRRMIK